MNVFLIWTRYDYGEKCPSEIILAETRESLKEKVKQYLIKNREQEDYWEGEEFQEYINDMEDILEDRAPELNCMYLTELVVKSIEK